MSRKIPMQSIDLTYSYNEYPRSSTPNCPYCAVPKIYEVTSCYDAFLQDLGLPLQDVRIRGTKKKFKGIVGGHLVDVSPKRKKKEKVAHVEEFEFISHPVDVPSDYGYCMGNTKRTNPGSHIRRNVNKTMCFLRTLFCRPAKK